jgi:hypothetical protein
MISSVDEALLLLRKWKADSALVVALIGRDSMIVRFAGIVDFVTEDASFSIMAGSNHIYVHMAKCSVNYAGAEELAQMMKNELPDGWQDSIHLEFPEGGGLSLFGLPSPPSSLR